MAEDDDRIRLSPERARAGSTPHMTRYILAFSLIAVIVAFAVILMI